MATFQLFHKEKSKEGFVLFSFGIPMATFHLHNQELKVKQLQSFCK